MDECGVRCSIIVEHAQRAVQHAQRAACLVFVLFSLEGARSEVGTTCQPRMCFRVMQCVAVCCRVLQRVVVCCRVLQCVAACCVLQRVAVCCHLSCAAVSFMCCSVLQCVAVCCSVLQCVAASFMCYSNVLTPPMVLGLFGKRDL